MMGQHSCESKTSFPTGTVKYVTSHWIVSQVLNIKKVQGSELQHCANFHDIIKVSSEAQVSV